MNNNNKIQINILATLTALFCLLISGAGQAAACLIYHPDLRDEDFSTGTLVRVFAMQKRVWSDGTPVRVYTLPKASATHRAFVTGYLRMQPYQLDRVWHRLVFSGTGAMPEEVSTVAEMLNVVASTPGAVGYINQDDTDQIPEGILRVVVNE